MFVGSKYTVTRKLYEIIIQNLFVIFCINVWALIILLLKKIILIQL